MEFEEALELVISTTKHEAWRQLCNPSNSQWEARRRQVMQLAGMPVPILPPVEAPKKRKVTLAEYARINGLSDKEAIEEMKRKQRKGCGCSKKKEKQAS